MKDFINYLKLNIDAESTRKQYILYITIFFNKYNILNQDNVNSWLAETVDNGLKASTFNTQLSVLKHYIKFKKIQIELPKIKKQNITISTYLTYKEIKEDIIPYFGCIFSNPLKRKLIFMFMFYTGLRINEVINLKKNNFNFDTNEIKVQNTKGKVDRIVYIHPSISDELKVYVENCKDTVFDITKKYIQYTATKINQELNINKNITPHTLRHSCATYLLKKGWQMHEVKDYLGHKDIRTTEKYAHIEKDEVKNKFLKLK